MYRFSTKFQWLPCEIEFRDQDDTGLEVPVKITSYINNLHPERHPELYHTLEKLI